MRRAKQGSTVPRKKDAERRTRGKNGEKKGGETERGESWKEEKEGRVASRATESIAIIRLSSLVVPAIACIIYRPLGALSRARVQVQFDLRRRKVIVQEEVDRPGSIEAERPR